MEAVRDDDVYAAEEKTDLDEENEEDGEDEDDEDDDSKTKKVTVDDLDLESANKNAAGGRDYVYTYRNRAFIFRQPSARAASDTPGVVFEKVGGKEKRLLDVGSQDAAEAYIAKYLNRTKDKTSTPRKRRRSYEVGLDDYYGDVRVGRGDGGGEYSKDKFAEGEGGGDYIKGAGEGSQSTRRGGVGRQEDNERAVRAAEIQNLPARHIELGEPMDQRTAESVISGFPMLTSDNDGRKVRLPIKTVGKILRHKGFEFSRIINELPELYQTSLFGWSEPEIPKEGHKAHSNVKEYHHYVNKFTDGDSEYYIRFTVNEEYTKPGASARNFIHSAAVSDIAVYKKGDHPRRGWVTFPGEAGPSPFVDRKLQEFFDKGEASQRIRVIDPGEASTSPSTDKIQPAGEKVNKKNKNLSDASRDPFAPDAETADAADSDLRPVEMPELVKMVEDLIGKRPAVMRRDKIKGGAYGYAVRVKDKATGEMKWVQVQLAAELPKDPAQAIKTIAHEIGHIMTKYGGQGKYGAIATKIKNAVHTLRQAIKDSPDSKNLTGLRAIYNELYAFSKKWRPFKEGKNAAHDKYRRKGEEVFADAVSAYLTNPAMLKREAPNFWRVFHGWEGARNPFTEVYKAVQELYGRGEEAVGAEREARTIAGYKRGDEISRETRARRDKEERESTALGRVIESIRDYLWERNGPLLKLVENVRKGGAKIADAVNPYLTKRAMPYLKSQQSAYVLDVRNALQEIIGPLDKDTRIDIGLYLQNARIALGDRGELWNPGGETSETSKAALKQLERRLGKERFELIKAAAEKFVEIRYDYIIPEIVNSGAFSKEYVEKVLNNKNYATFDVIRELSKEHGLDAVKGIIGLDALPVGAHKQTGTTKDVRNPLIATLANDVKMLAFIDRNNAAKNTVDLLLNHKNTLGFEAVKQERRRDGGYDKHENTVFVLRKGKTVAYQVSEELVPMFKFAGKPHVLLRVWDAGLPRERRGNADTQQGVPLLEREHTGAAGKPERNEGEPWAGGVDDGRLQHVPGAGKRAGREREDIGDAGAGLRRRRRGGQKVVDTVGRVH